MRYQPLDRNLPDSNIAAVWPSLEALAADQAGKAGAAGGFTVTTAAPDLPAAVGGLIAAPYAGLMAVFFAFYARSPVALFSDRHLRGFRQHLLRDPAHLPRHRGRPGATADPGALPAHRNRHRDRPDRRQGRAHPDDDRARPVTLGLAAIGIIARITIG